MGKGVLMPCYHPIKAWQTEGGEIKFSETGKIRRELELACGRCIGCRLRRSRNWAIRCMHESSMHPLSSFVTLTYDSVSDPSLCYRDFQLFMKRMRKSSVSPIRFFAVGEYGSDFQRPHFHALLFGKWFDDRKRHSKTLFRSDALERLWPHGYSTIGDVTFQSAGYCARYCCEKVTGPMAEDHYKRVDVRTGEIVPVVPEFAHMSLRPGIGYPWFQKYWKEVYEARDGVVVNGKTYPPPRYYDDLLDQVAPDLSCEKEYDRYVNSQRFIADCTPERLAVRETVDKAKLKMLKRDL